MIDDRTEAILENLLIGAVGVSTALTAAAIGLEIAGIRDLFNQTGTAFLIEIVRGWFRINGVVFVAAGLLQLLSYRTPIPPVVVLDQQERDHS